MQPARSSAANGWAVCVSIIIVKRREDHSYFACYTALGLRIGAMPYLARLPIGDRCRHRPNLSF